MTMQTVKIFLASSAELKEDRRAFELMLGRKNKDWHKRGVFLELVIWEDFLDAMSQTRLQDEYNKALTGCDLFVMLYFTKVGMYTAEEFETAFGQFKESNTPRIYTYFKNAAITTGSANRADLQSLWAFQDKLNALGHFPTEYDTTDRLENHFKEQLEKLATSGFIKLQAPAAGVGDVARSEPAGTTEQRLFIDNYLRFLVSELTRLPLGGIDPQAQQPGREPLQLADVYVSLNTNVSIDKDASLKAVLARDSWSERSDTERQEWRKVSVLEAVATHTKLTLLGKPGSGKSTFGAHVLLALAQDQQAQPSALQALSEYWTHGSLLPVRVVLRRFAEWLQTQNARPCADILWRYLGQQSMDDGVALDAEVARRSLQQQAQQCGAFFLFDGLDECGTTEQRERVQAVVQKFIKSAGARCRFLLTARPYAFPFGSEPNEGIYTLDELDAEQIEAFIHGWYAALARRNWLAEQKASQKRDDLLGAWQRPDLHPLASNPLLLTLMATVHSNRGRLPDDRADLYNESVELLLLRWNQQIGADKALIDELGISLKLTDVREKLEEIAFAVHSDNAAQDADEVQDAADIGEHRLLKAFESLLGGLDKARKVIEYIEKRAGLLIGQGERNGELQFAFPHRTFQEYLAACDLAKQKDFEQCCVELARSAPAHWQVVLPLAARVAGPSRGASAADALVGRVDIDKRIKRGQVEVAEWGSAQLAGEMLLELGLPAVRSKQDVAAIPERIRDWLVAGLPLHPSQGGAPAAQRARASVTLARLGDPRFDPQRFFLPADDTLGFVYIPADPQFRRGMRSGDVEDIARKLGITNSQDELLEIFCAEINDEPTPTAEFYMARYSVTVAQFRAFVEDAAYEVEDADALHGLDNHPVVGISWDEARAYCDWLTAKLRVAPEFAGHSFVDQIRNQGWQVVLPSEDEWEKAARGGSVTLYPWGDTFDPERANCDVSGVHGPRAVGCFAANAYQLHDMHGNVWDWTDSVGDEDREHRIVRGGSWFHSFIDARSACRQFAPRSHVYGLRGFRFALKSREPGQAAVVGQGF